MRLCILLLVSLLALAACDSVEERAEQHYENALELIGDGDVDRAIVELRNVFQLVPGHLDARRAMAEVMLNEKNNKPAAFREYLRIAEQQPDDVDALINLTELSFEIESFDNFQRYSEQVIELAPDEPRVAVIKALADYRNASLEEDETARSAAAARASALVSSNPQSAVLRMILLDDQVRSQNLTAALETLEWLISSDPENQRYAREKTRLLFSQGDFAAVEQHLRELAEAFPDDPSHKSALLQYLIQRQELDKAEAYLRDLVAAEPDSDGYRADLVRFVRETRGIEAARDEAERLLADDPDNGRLVILANTLAFESGETQTAISALETFIETTDPGEDGDIVDMVNTARVALAQMYAALDDRVEARALVEQTLASDPENTNALKMRARWRVDLDETDGAIADLRLALDNAPEDAEALSLMATAYVRSGQQQLAEQFLALAVDASGNRAAETISYARILLSDARYRPAEDTLLAALRRDPQNVDLLVLLGQAYTGLEDNARMEQVVRALSQLQSPEARDAAVALEAELINRRSGSDAAVSFIEELAEGEDATLRTKLFLVRAQVATGNIEEALELVRGLQAENPDVNGLRLLLANLEGSTGNTEKAESIYREMIEAEPGQDQIWLELSRLKTRMQDPEGARQMIDDGLDANPTSPALLWAKASVLEVEGDVDGAIEIYEGLYERDSSSVIVANNLASLLATYKNDEASLDRAWTIARRLRDSELPALQDTYGWIAQRRGESEEALPYLEAAAAGLPADPLVQYHLAETYFSLERFEDALDAYRRAVSVAGPLDTRDQIVRAREQVLALEAPVAAE
ncbi:MAG: tetratricopeptide repeat protein [Pseudomonadota bacterium]